MHSDAVVSVKDLSKVYRLFSHPGDRVKQFFSLGFKRYHREFEAIKKVSFDIRKGETVGIIGRNGSGKSTLLQLICGILKPTSGSVQVSGRISAMLELGAGFNPDFTGRENVFFQGAITGMSREEMLTRFDEIAAFAEIGEFIDQPVRTYSSGMYLRLAFAVAVHVVPDVLIVDEALAVGDANFQKRCYARIRKLQQEGVTVILVSHDYELVRTLTNRALLLDEGVALYFGETREATRRYRKILFEKDALQLAKIAPTATQPQKSLSVASNRDYGIGGAKINSLRVLGVDGHARLAFQPREQMIFEIDVQTEIPLDQLNVSIVIRTLQGWKIYSWGTFNQDISVWARQGKEDVFWDKQFQPGDNFLVTFGLECNLGAGNYEVQAVVSRELDRRYGSQQVLNWRDEMGTFRVELNSSEYFFGGLCDLHAIATFDD